MAVSSPCPPATRLRQLLAGEAADEAELTTHLDWCEACRQRLEAFAVGDSSLLDAALHSGDGYLHEPPLRRALHAIAGARDQSTIRRLRDEVAKLPPAARPAEVPHQLGGCDVTRLLGQGGMGLVYQAFDPALKRWVAIKVLSPHLAGEALARLRFAREAQAAAAVSHENIITIHAVNETNGLPYFVMEYLSGGSLQDILDRQQRLAWPVIARIGAEVASGLAAAHNRGLIHRDIKPSNVLLQASDDPAAPGVAKIGDFGLARVADDSRLTRTGQIAGTPMYMSPEQSLGEPLDHRADLFSLGSVLYSLCTGRDPFPGGTPVVVLRQVCELSPTPVRRLNPDIPPWLAAVVERLQAKRPADRLSSAAEVAEILRFNLKHPESPRVVPPPRPHGRMSRHRHRLLVAAALAALLLPGAFLLSGSAVRDSAAARSQPAEGVATRVPLRATLRGHGGPVLAASFSPDGRMLVTGSDDTTLRFWDVATGRQLAERSGDRSGIYAVAFAHSGAFLVSGSGDGSVRVWDVATRKERMTLPHGGGSVRRIAISPDDKTVAVGSNTHDVELWDLGTRAIRQSLAGHHGTILAIAFSADGKTLATGDARGNIRFWDPQTGAEREGFSGDQLSLRALAFSPDRKTLASAGGKDVKLWRVADRRRFATLGGMENGLVCVAFSVDGSLVAAGSREGNIVIWDVRTARIRASFEAHRGLVYALAFGPDGRTLASVGEDFLGQLWDLRGLRDAAP